jgi:hypothetical protein
LLTYNSSAATVPYPLAGGFSLYNCTVVRPAGYTKAGPAFSNTGTSKLYRIARCLGSPRQARWLGSPESNNASEASTNLPATLTNTLTVAYSTATFVNAGGTTAFDYRTASSASGLIDVGVVDVTNIPTFDDITGTERAQGSAWDVGCWEYKPTAPSFRRPSMCVMG